jgi:hypothetical protein
VHGQTAVRHAVGGERGSGSFDAIAGSMNSLFNFRHEANDRSTLFLDPTTGQPVRRRWRGLGTQVPAAPIEAALSPQNEHRAAPTARCSRAAMGSAMLRWPG